MYACTNIKLFFTEQVKYLHRDALIWFKWPLHKSAWWNCLHKNVTTLSSAQIHIRVLVQWDLHVLRVLGKYIAPDCNDPLFEHYYLYQYRFTLNDDKDNNRLWYNMKLFKKNTHIFSPCIPGYFTQKKLVSPTSMNIHLVSTTII